MGDILEKEIEAEFCKKIKKRGGLCLKFVSPGHAGVPDRVVMIYRKIIFVEFKAPGKKPRPLQQAMFKKMKDCGVDVKIISSIEEVENFFTKLENGWW